MPSISSGDPKLDELLKGGFRRELKYFLYGSKKIINNILHSTAVSFQKVFLDDGLGGRIAYIDATDKFSPYKISTLALSMRLDPSIVLDNILIFRAFTWSQMVEILKYKLLKLDDIRIVLVSGITTLFEMDKQRTLEDLAKAINSIKKVVQKTKSTVIITAPLHERSYIRVKGRNVFSHFANVLVLINDEDRFTEYRLIQHPYLPNKRVIKWKARKQKVDASKTLKNTTLDFWLS